ncbi:phytanoyl-CoA dioxygenase family protein [Planctomycetota bacterium]
MKKETDFAIAPTDEELAQHQGEFQFVASENATPNVLTNSQVDGFNAHGYVFDLPVFAANEIAIHREFFDGLLAEAQAGGGDSYSISSAHLTNGRVYDLLNEPRIVNVVADLLGENVIGWGSHYFCKMPGDGRPVAWHQDTAYWPMSESRTVTVWLAIDDADQENGCMKYVRGSHQHGLFDHRAESADATSVLDRGISNAEQYGEVVDIPLRAGRITVHSDLLVHSSPANHSARRRCGLTLRYCVPEVRAGLGWNAKGVVVRGTDPTGHWANPGRP